MARYTAPQPRRGGNMGGYIVLIGIFALGFLCGAGVIIIGLG